jgi:hypothetical protein
VKIIGITSIARQGTGFRACFLIAIRFVNVNLICFAWVVDRVIHFAASN